MPTACQRLSLLVSPLICLLVLGGCGHQFPQRPFVDTSQVVHKPSPDCVRKTENSKQSTPERGETFTLHFIEFDDHGWTYENTSTGFVGPRARVGNPSQQLDCAIEHLAQELRDDKKVALYLYVHGWHHNANSEDKDVEKFRRLLKRYGDSAADRKVIGIYVGWDGESIGIPYVSDVLTFFPRKSAAHRVANGRVRELFGRIKGMREFHNKGFEGKDCAARQLPGPDLCKLRAVMIGHSFGGLILFSAVQPYLLEALTTVRDLKEAGLDSQEPRSRGISDLVVLINPAFEATLYEPLHRAAETYPGDRSTPMLVSLTSSADLAVGKAFQLARNVSTLFHYPANSERASEAIRDTIGNVDKYLTHYLCVTATGCVNPLKDSQMDVVHICGMELHSRVKATPIWNVRTNKEIISSHNDIMRDRTINFFEYAYAINTKGRLPCVQPKADDPISSLPPVRLLNDIQP